MMGMLWFEEEKDLVKKVVHAADYYRQKYGRVPEVCLVPVAELASETHLGILLLKPSRSVMPKHLLIGFEEKRHVDQPV